MEQLASGGMQERIISKKREMGATKKAKKIQKKSTFSHPQFSTLY